MTMIPAVSSPSPQRQALAVGVGALGALQVALCDVEALGTPTGVAVRNLDHDPLDPDDLTTVIIRMSNSEAAYALADCLNLTDRVQCPMGHARRWWAQSYSGKWGGLVRVQILSLADYPWPEDLVRRLTVGEVDAVAALLGAVSL